MLYQLYTMATQLLRPLNRMARCSHAYWTSQRRHNPHSLLMKMIDANALFIERDTREYGHPSFNITHVDKGNGELCPVTEQVVLETAFCDLRHFLKSTKVAQEKILIVAPLSGHHATLLRDTVTTLLADFDVYITDWKNVRDIPLSRGEFSLDDYIALLLTFFAHLKGDMHVMAVCQPTVPVVVATTICEQTQSQFTPKSLILMGGPIDTRINPSQVNDFASSHTLDWFSKYVITSVPAPFLGAKRRVCPGFIMLTGFMSLDPKRHMESYFKFYESLIEGSGEAVSAHTKFYDEYRSVMDLPCAYILETLDRVFQRHLLPKNQFTWRDIHVDLGALQKTPILTIEGELDRISPVGQTVAIHEITTNLPSSKKFHHFQKGAGHYGIFSGRKWRHEVAPVMKDFVTNSVKNTAKNAVARQKLPADKPAVSSSPPVSLKNKMA